MEVNMAERRQSAAVPPPWLEAKPQPYTNVFVGGTAGSGNLSPGIYDGTSRHSSLTPGAPGAQAIPGPNTEEGYHLRLSASNKIQIHDRHDCNIIFFFI